MEKLEEILENTEDETKTQWQRTYPDIIEAAKEVLGTSVPGKYLREGLLVVE